MDRNQELFLKLLYLNYDKTTPEEVEKLTREFIDSVCPKRAGVQINGATHAEPTKTRILTAEKICGYIANTTREFLTEIKTDNEKA